MTSNPLYLLKTVNRFVKMAVVLTTSEDMISEAEKKKQEELLIKQA